MVQEIEIGLAGISRTQEGIDIGAVATIDESISHTYDNLDREERLAYDRLSAQLKHSGFNLTVGGYSYTMFKKHDCSGLVENLRAAGFNVPHAIVEAPEIKRYLVVEVSPSETLSGDESCLGHEYFLKARFHSRLSILMTNGAVPLNDESRVLGSRNTSTYDYQIGTVNLKVVYVK